MQLEMHTAFDSGDVMFPAGHRNGVWRQSSAGFIGDWEGADKDEVEQLHPTDWHLPAIIVTCHLCKVPLLEEDKDLMWRHLWRKHKTYARGLVGYLQAADSKIASWEIATSENALPQWELRTITREGVQLADLEEFAQ